MLSKRLATILAIVLFILLIPAIAMQFTDEVNWGVMDFVVAGFLLVGTGLLCDLTLKKVPNTKFRFLILIVILVLLFLIWAELAVGLFETTFSEH